MVDLSTCWQVRIWKIVVVKGVIKLTRLRLDDVKCAALKVMCAAVPSLLHIDLLDGLSPWRAKCNLQHIDKPQSLRASLGWSAPPTDPSWAQSVSTQSDGFPICLPTSWARIITMVSTWRVYRTKSKTWRIQTTCNWWKTKSLNFEAMNPKILCQGTTTASRGQQWQHNHNAGSLEQEWSKIWSH